MTLQDEKLALKAASEEQESAFSPCPSSCPLQGFLTAITITEKPLRGDAQSRRKADAGKDII
jgi:hypothetical protein